MHRFRIAFVGLDHPHGAGWRKALLNLADEIEITAIVPRFDGATASLEERHTGAARFETVEQLIAAGGFEGAIVCLPNNEAPSAVVQLAAAGKHVLAEKPVAGSACDAGKIADAVRAAGVAFQNGYMWRYDPGASRLREMVADGRGRLVVRQADDGTLNAAGTLPPGPNGLPIRAFALTGGEFYPWTGEL